MSAPAAVIVNAPLPVATTLPARPTAPMSWAIHGGGRETGDSITVTLSNAAVVNAAVLWLVTAMPTSAAFPRESDAVPTGVHDVPSDETSPENVDPLRVRRSHAGGVRTPLAMTVVGAPAADRVM